VRPARSCSRPSRVISDRAVEDALDTVNVEYLDVLIDITGDDYMGSVTVG
jgi:hypothetical protein